MERPISCLGLMRYDLDDFDNVYDAIDKKQ